MSKKTASPTAGFRSYALSDQGVRSNNEDLVHNDDERGIYFVVDGMGGHAAGEQAAQIAAERLRGRLERATGSPQQRLREAITLANNAIFEAATQHSDWNGMACVLTVALVSPQTATIGHVGDSRLYKVADGTLEKITRDHSPVGELEDSKELDEAHAMAHPRRNEVYRDVGSAPHDPGDKDFIDIYETPVEPDSALLLCSDGLTDAVPAAEIRKILRDKQDDPASAVQSLIDQAKKRDGKDNISVVLVQGPAFGGAQAPPPRKEEVPPQPARSIVIEERRAPIWQRAALAVLWMALGAAAFFAAERWGIPLWEAQAPRTAASKVARKPLTVMVNPSQPGAQPSITAAMSVAAEGDTVELAPGLYEEPVRIEKSNILLDGSGALLRPKPTPDGVDGITIANAAGVRIQNLRISGDADGDLLTGVHVVDSQVTLRNVHVVNAAGPGVEAGGSSTLRMDASSIRDCSGPGLILRGAATATVKYTAIVGNGRDPKDRQPGILSEAATPAVLLGNTLANNGGPAIAQPDVPSRELLANNLFSLDGRKGRLEDVRVTRKRARP
ncbi:MAG TPA: protein phosphatase 2C domain-containing protein [Bryobacteraceae bacterium]|jgi:serine/threonine protein phosphatase PrpC